jgi:23S rRNA (adenine2030-N6)-methyltransferase
MNYRHAFHAGNFADVVKHLVLLLCLQRLNAKDKPWRYIDTHSGVGRYDLSSDAARRSPEWRDGIARVWEAEASAPADVRDVLAPFMELLRGMNPGGELAAYPGSPLIAQAMARDGDALRLCELHPEDAETLREAMGRDRRMKIENRDGYDALPAFLPPPERRGVVLVDPPFEKGSAERKDDFDDMLGAARKGIQRWKEGVYIFWRPLKDLDAVEAFDGDIATFAIEEAGIEPEKVLVADLWVRELGLPGPLAGAGVVIVNPPYGLREQLEILLPWLADLMDQTPDGEDSAAGWRLLSPEAEEGEAGEDDWEEDEDPPEIDLGELR